MDSEAGVNIPSIGIEQQQEAAALRQVLLYFRQFIGTNDLRGAGDDEHIKVSKHQIGAGRVRDDSRFDIILAQDVDELFVTRIFVAVRRVFAIILQKAGGQRLGIGDV